MAPIYLDHNGTTPVAPAVWAAMQPYYERYYGNPSSRHEFGRMARSAIDEAREKVADAVGAHPSQVIFTSGGTEANNLALKGTAACLPPSQLLISAIEHPCIAQPARDLQEQGWRLRRLAVNGDGELDWADLEAALRQPTGLVSVMLANNETGVLQNIAVLSELARRGGALVHTDAVQALGKIEVEFRALGVDLMTLSAHKIYGPKGVGALIVDKAVELKPLLSGGGHERGLRAGTENVPAIVGFGVACEAVGQLLAHSASTLRDRLETGLRALGAEIFGAAAGRLANTSFFAFPAIDGETLVMAWDRAGFAVASGSACSSSSAEPSAVLLAMGVAPELAKGAVRVSLGAGNTPEQIDGFLATLQQELRRLRTYQAVIG